MVCFINLISFVYNSDIDLYDNRNKTYITYDSIGEKLQNDKKANIFYIKEFLLGIIILIHCIVQAVYGNMVIGLFIIIYTIFLFYFGMADVLQDDNYNSPDYGYLYKDKKMYENILFPN